MEKIKTKLCTLRFSMLLFVGAGLIAGFVIYLLVNHFIEEAMLNLMSPRPDALVFVSGYNVSITFSGNSVSSEITNQSLFDFLHTVSTISPAVIFSLCIIFTIFLFYRMTVQKPLETLKVGIEKISEKELDFTLKTSFKNELGNLCSAFETMRRQLAMSFQSLWESEENQRNLYRAFAHDLRTPLSIIKGNNDNIELVAFKNNDWNSALESVNLSNDAIRRIELYAEELKTLESIQDFQPKIQQADLTIWCDTIRKEANILSQQSYREISIISNCTGSANIDPDTLIRVLDNLLDNAIRHCSKGVEVKINLKGSVMSVSVSDDGSGFTPEAYKQAAMPFFTTDKEGGHMGIGLTISQRLIEKCGGNLSIINNPSGGAIVKFFIPI